MGGLDQTSAADPEFQPGIPGNFHLRRQKKALSGPKIQDLPEIETVADPEIRGIPPAAIQARSAEHFIGQAAKLPQPRKGEPSAIAADRDNGSKYGVGRRVRKIKFPGVAKNGVARQFFASDIASSLG